MMCSSVFQKGWRGVFLALMVVISCVGAARPVMAMMDDTQMIEATAAESFTAKSAILPRTGWIAQASDQLGANTAAASIDGSATTLWHSQAVPLPHSVTIDMRGLKSVSGVRYLPRQDALSEGNIGQYSISTSQNGSVWGVPVASGTWRDDKTIKTVVFPGVIARFVRITALSEAGGRSNGSAAAELYVVGNQLSDVTLPINGWTAAASDEYAANAAAKALDGQTTTFWHSNYTASGTTPLPHTVTIDMKEAKLVSGLTYLPRQDAYKNGTIGQYEVRTSPDGITWTGPVAKSAWADDKTLKVALFPETSARYVRLTALSEAGNRGQWSSVAELRVIGSQPNMQRLSRAGWTATASDTASSHPASYVLDGSASTQWNSYYAGTTQTKLPHTVTIDTKAVRLLNGLSYQPRQDAYVSGVIGRYEVRVSTDGSTWGAPVASGTWADNKFEKYAVFNAVSARYIRLTALSEAGNRNQYANIAELNVFGTGSVGASAGAWSAPVNFPLVPSTYVMLPNNKVLLMAGYSNTAFSQTVSGHSVTRVAIYDIATGRVTQGYDVNLGHQMFCSGLAVLADGRVLVNGGSDDAATSVYNPYTNAWTAVAKMTIPRAYQSTTLLSNGAVFTLGGSWDSIKGVAYQAPKNGEVYSPATNTWRKLPNVDLGLAANKDALTADYEDAMKGYTYRGDNHMWLFAVSGGNVFQAGPSRMMHWIGTSGNGAMQDAGLRGDSLDAMNGNAIMYDVNKVLALGGAEHYQAKDSKTGAQATNRAYVIDLSRGYGVNPSVTRTGDMVYRRGFSNSVVLPDGTVIVFGGQQSPVPFTDTAAALTPELWSPTTGKFTLLATDTIPRTYHSGALLLPDGRILSAGGGLCGDACTTNHPDGRIFTPPYLLNSDGSLRRRPSLSGVPSDISLGSTVAVTATGATNFALVRMAAVTHSINTDQRRIPLEVVAMNGDVASLRVPADSGVVLPGTYMLFALDERGTPSLAVVTKIH